MDNFRRTLLTRQQVEGIATNLDNAIQGQEIKGIYMPLTGVYNSNGSWVYKFRVSFDRNDLSQYTDTQLRFYISLGTFALYKDNSYIDLGQYLYNGEGFSGNRFDNEVSTYAYLSTSCLSSDMNPDSNNSTQYKYHHLCFHNPVTKYNTSSRYGGDANTGSLVTDDVLYIYVPLDNWYYHFTAGADIKTKATFKFAQKRQTVQLPIYFVAA